MCLKASAVFCSLELRVNIVLKRKTTERVGTERAKLREAKLTDRSIILNDVAPG